MMFSVTIALAMVGMLALTAGSLLSFPLTAVDSLWSSRRTPVRSAVRAGLVMVHVGFGLWVFRFLTSSYTHALGEYNPASECEGGWAGGDLSGCVPVDLRWQWAVFWVATGLVAFVMVRSSAMKAEAAFRFDAPETVEA